MDNDRADAAWRRVLEGKFSVLAERMDPDRFEEFVIAFFSGEGEEKLRRVNPNHPFLELIRERREYEQNGFY